jgi:hypothetical protein
MLTYKQFLNLSFNRISPYLRKKDDSEIDILKYIDTFGDNCFKSLTDENKIKANTNIINILREDDVLSYEKKRELLLIVWNQSCGPNERYVSLNEFESCIDHLSLNGESFHKNMMNKYSCLSALSPLKQNEVENLYQEYICDKTKGGRKKEILESIYSIYLDEKNTVYDKSCSLKLSDGDILSLVTNFDSLKSVLTQNNDFKNVKISNNNESSAKITATYNGTKSFFDISKDGIKFDSSKEGNLQLAIYSIVHRHKSKQLNGEKSTIKVKAISDASYKRIFNRLINHGIKPENIEFPKEKKELYEQLCEFSSGVDAIIGIDSEKVSIPSILPSVDVPEPLSDKDHSVMPSEYVESNVLNSVLSSHNDNEHRIENLPVM